MGVKVSSLQNLSGLVQKMPDLSAPVFRVPDLRPPNLAEYAVKAIYEEIADFEASLFPHPLDSYMTSEELVIDELARF